MSLGGKIDARSATFGGKIEACEPSVLKKKINSYEILKRKKGKKMEKKFSSTAMSFTSLAFCFSGTLIPQSGMIRMSNCLKSKEYKILVHLRGVRGMKSKNSHSRRKAKRISYIYYNDSVIFHR